MTQLPLLSGQQVVVLLAKVGYRVVRQKGSHMRLEVDGRKPVTVPHYKQIDRSLLRKILRDAELTADEFIELER